MRVTGWFVVVALFFLVGLTVHPGIPLAAQGDAAEKSPPSADEQQKRSAYERDVKKSLDEYDGKFQWLKKQAEEETARYKADMQRDLSRVAAARAKAKQAFTALKTSGKKSWEELKMGMETALVELRRAFGKAEPKPVPKSK